MNEHRQSRVVARAADSCLSVRMTTSGHVLMAMTQQNNAELVLLLEGIQLGDASMANSLSSNQCDAGAGTDLI